MQIKRTLQNDINTVAKIGLYLDDPYGDGIRLIAIREPDQARLAALQQVAGQPLFCGDVLIMDKYFDRVLEAIKLDRRRKWLILKNVPVCYYMK